MYKFDLLASALETEEEPKNVVVEETNDVEEGLDVISHECNSGLSEIQEGVDEFKALIASFSELQEVKTAIESYGIDDLLLSQVGDNLDKIAKSFKSKDAEATLAEIEESTEGIIDYIKEKASNLKARWKNGWTKAMKADSKIRQKLIRSVDSAKKVGDDVAITNKKIVAYGYMNMETTMAAIEKIFLKAVSIPRHESDKSIFEMWTADQTKLIESYKLDDPKCLIKYYFDWHTYKADESQSPEPMTIEESGVANVKDLVKFGEMVINSSFGNEKIGNEFNKQYEEIIKALMNLPFGEQEAIYNLYNNSVNSLFTGFIEGEAILRQYAVQTLIALQDVSK